MFHPVLPAAVGNRAAGGLALAISLAILVAVPATAVADVTSEGTSASLFAGQHVNGGINATDSKDEFDFVGFSEALAPRALVGPEGRASAFASQASAVITPQSVFPLDDLDGAVARAGSSSKRARRRMDLRACRTPSPTATSSSTSRSALRPRSSSLPPPGR